jgi:hypothetical protein
MLTIILRRSLLLLLINTLLPGCVFARPLVHVATSVSGRVIDAENGQPLKGVIVTINWELTGGMHHYPQGQAHVDETVTDAQGKFTFAGWGPKPAPVAAHLYESTPQLLFFKSGYAWDKCVSDLDTDVNTRVPLSSDCDGKTMKLKKFTGSLEAYAKRLSLLDDYFRFAFTPDGNCEWKQIPRMLVAMHQERLLLDKAGLPPNAQKPHSLEYRTKALSPAESKRCGSIEEFLRSYLP